MSFSESKNASPAPLWVASEAAMENLQRVLRRPEEEGEEGEEGEVGPGYFPIGRENTLQGINR